MQDYFYTRKNGERVRVAEMTNLEIRACLADGINVNDSDGNSIAETEIAIKKRLEIELVARNSNYA